MISLIAAIGIHNELGASNDLLWHLPADMKHFRETTRGHTVVMGRKTFESIGQPLPNRRNIVITRRVDYTARNSEIVGSVDEAIQLINNDEEAFIIGGAEIYQQALESADKLYITHVDAEFPIADTFFPTIDPKIWHKTKSTTIDKDDTNQYNMEFAEYERV